MGRRNSSERHQHNKKPPAHTPEPAGRQTPHGGSVENPHGKTTTGKPKPAASAADAQEPEPRPQSRRKPKRKEPSHLGQGAAGNTTNPNRHHWRRREPRPLNERRKRRDPNQRRRRKNPAHQARRNARNDRRLAHTPRPPSGQPRATRRPPRTLAGETRATAAGHRKSDHRAQRGGGKQGKALARLSASGQDTRRK